MNIKKQTKTYCLGIINYALCLMKENNIITQKSLKNIYGLIYDEIKNYKESEKKEEEIRPEPQMIITGLRTGDKNEI